MSTLLLIAALALSTNDSDRLLPVLSLDVVTNGVAVSHDGRIFLVLVRGEGDNGPRVVEWVSGSLRPYPNDAWNSWAPDGVAASGFVAANALRIGPDGDLWVVDAGSLGLGHPKITGGPKLVRISIDDNSVRRVYDLDKVTRGRSFVDDIRFHGNNAYLTDAGEPGIIVLDLSNGRARRVLDRDVSTTARKPFVAEGQRLHGADCRPVYIHTDQLEVSPDGRWLYYQVSSGPLYRIETRWLDDKYVTDVDRSKRVERFAETEATGGSAIDAAGNLYMSDIDHNRILKIAPDGTVTTLVEDRRLEWPDAMWIDDAGFLWIPAAQLNRMAAFQGGKSSVVFPVRVYQVEIGEKPAQNDHR